MSSSGIDWNLLFAMPNLAIFVGTVMGCLLAIVGIMTSIWGKVQRSRSLDELKLSLVERGLSVEEIERIVRAAPESSED